MTEPHSHSLRHGRYSAENQIYLVTTVTHQRKAIFTNVFIGRIVINIMKYMHDDNQVSSLAFVIMPDHIHWLIQLKDPPLDKVMHSFKGVSAKTVNQYLNRQGKLWQAGYHDHAVRQEEDLLDIARYIMLNPVRAGLVKKVGEYCLWDAVWL